MSAMGLAVPLLSASTLPHCAMAALEGVVIAARDSRFHVLSYIISGSLFLAYEVSDFVSQRYRAAPSNKPDHGQYG